MRFLNLPGAHAVYRHPSDKASGVCDHCVGITNGSDLDVVEIDGASNTGVDNIRELRERVNYTAFSAKYKVYIIDEVHMLSTGAFNAERIGRDCPAGIDSAAAPNCR